MNNLKNQLRIVELAIERIHLTDKLTELRNRHETVEKELRTMCPHVDTYTTESYFPGGYLDRSYVKIYTWCTLCGKQLSEHYDKNHYGSFA